MNPCKNLKNHPLTIASQVGVQFIGVVATFAYTAIATYIILKVVGMMVGLRVSPEEEQQGLDILENSNIQIDLDFVEQEF
jgi:Amt family ammonium transporter